MVTCHLTEATPEAFYSYDCRVTAGITIDAIEDTPETFDVDFGWTPVAADT